MSTQAARPLWSKAYLAQQLERAVLAPVRAYRVQYLPLLMVYFAYGALGLISIAENFWVKKQLTLTPAELASLAAWITLPWTIKMVFGELVDSVPILGSQRRGYVYLGGALVAAGFLILAGAAGGWLNFASPENLYRLASFVTVVGVVLQDVVADAMSTEVVERHSADGTPRPQAEITHDLGMVQVLGRLALALGSFAVAGIAGWLASVVSYQTVFLCGLIIPAVSVSGAMLVSLETPEQRPVDWRILGGGLAYGAFVVVMALTSVTLGQEIVFVVSMAVVLAMLRHVVADVDAETRRRIFYAALLIFAFRATPTVGQGFTWFTMDVLGFDEAFFGTLGQIGAGLALVGTWVLSDAITRQPVARVLLWLTLLTGVLSLPNLALTLRLDQWTERTLDIGARGIAILDAAAASPFLQLSMIPLLTLTAIYAPAGRRASWFALMASLMNLALVAGQLQTKYLNLAFAIDRGAYGMLPGVMAIVIVIGLAVPLIVIMAVGRRVQ